jgi:hypothetical protein
MTRLGFLALAGLVLLAGCRGSGGKTFADLDSARATSRELRVLLNQTSDASNRAVMAETDEASKSYVQEAVAASAELEREVADLEPVLRRLDDRDALVTLAAFRRDWSSYRELDRDILALAVENTNLKAQRLSFGPAHEAAEALRGALVIATTSKPNDWHAQALARDVELAVREIQVLHAPHIAERDDAAMTALETRIAALARRAHGSLEELAKVEGTPRPEASAALSRFEAVSAEIVQLSRKNTNLRSLDLALGKKPAVVSACDARLRDLSDGLAKIGAHGSR